MARDPKGYIGLCWEKEEHFKQRALERNQCPGERIEGLKEDTEGRRNMWAG